MSPAETFRNQLTDVAFRWKYTEEGKRAGVEHFLTVDKNRELAVATFLELDVCAEILSQVRRHPGGLDTRDSVATTTDRNGHLRNLRATLQEMWNQRRDILLIAAIRGSEVLDQKALFLLKLEHNADDEQEHAEECACCAAQDGGTNNR